MKSLRLFLFSCLVTVTACAELTPYLEAGADVLNSSGNTLQANRVSAIKEALELGSSRATEQLSSTGGYSQNPLYKIKLPQELAPITQRLRQFGLGKQLDEVEALMNQGAEKAALEARAVFIDTIRNMTISDALGIVRGNDTAATDYFRQNTEVSLRERYLPIIQQNLSQIGFYQSYKTFLNTYQQLPLSSKPNLDLEQHVLDKSLSALFNQIAVEEKLIREDPIGRGSALIEAVFSQNPK